MLPEMQLDDLRFQELVSEARTRIVRLSPGWTEHNVSDPGITLLELFAWLTDILLYRINRIPERMHEALLELVGVQLGGPAYATTDVRFRLAGDAPLRVPAGVEVAAPRAADQDAVVFRTVDDLEIPAARLAAYAVSRARDVRLSTAEAGRIEPADDQRDGFARPPAPGDALLLGFAEPLAGLVVRADFEATPAAGSGVDPLDPPLAWEASGADGSWLPATVITDQTGGFLHADGAVTVDVPSGSGAAEIAGRRLHWLRCRVTERTAAGRRAGYARPPRIGAVSAAVVGGTVRAAHAATVTGESLGTSGGVPGVPCALRHRPVLPLADGETLEVREPGASEWVAWTPVPSFSASLAADRHFLLDAARGEIRFGPAIRQPDGGWRRFGAVPPAGSLLRFSRYRFGGGVAGNVAAGALRVLPTPIAGVASVSNPQPATGGADPESLEHGRDRAALEIRSRSRAVTRDDFERLTLAASPGVARAVCVVPAGAAGAAVRVHVLPRVEPADRQLALEELTPGAELMGRVAGELDRRRLLGTSVRLLPVKLRGVSVVADVRASPLADLERVEQDVAHALYVYLNPLIGGRPDGPGDGWPLGRVLNQGELFGIAYAIPGVEFVNILRMYETDLRTGEQAPQPTDSHLALAADELIASGRHIVKATYREQSLA